MEGSSSNCTLANTNGSNMDPPKDISVLERLETTEDGSKASTNATRTTRQSRHNGIQSSFSAVTKSSRVTSKVSNRSIAAIQEKMKNYIDLAEYEINVDPYRGITSGAGDCAGDSTGNNGTSAIFYTRCRDIVERKSFRRTAHDDNATGDGEDELDAYLPFTSCPSIQMWYEEALTKRDREEAKKKQKLKRSSKRNKKRSNNNVNKTSSNQPEIIDMDGNAENGDSNIQERDAIHNMNNDEESMTNFMSSNIPKATRNLDPFFSCRCDFNPFCLVSMGGPLDDYMYKMVQSASSTDEHKIKLEPHCREAGTSEGHNNSGISTKKRKLDMSLESPTTIKSPEQPVMDFGEDYSKEENIIEIKDTTSAEGSESSIRPPTKQQRVDHNSLTNISTNSSSLIIPIDNLENIQPSGIYTPDNARLFENTGNSETSEHGGEESLSLDLYQGREEVHIEIERVEDYVSQFVLSDGIGKEDPSYSVNQYIDEIRKWHWNLMKKDSSSQNVRNNELLDLCMPCGMKNLGATCYLNSLFQCLAMNHNFIKGVFSWTRENNGGGNNEQMHRVLSNMQFLLARMVHGYDSVANPQEFSTSLDLIEDEMQDPNEFASLLFDRMHETFFLSSSLDLKDLIPSMFQGTYAYNTTCQGCDHISSREETFRSLPLAFFEFDKSTIPHDLTIQMCLENYLEADVLDGDNQYSCSNCVKKCDAKRKLSFINLPPILNTQLGRYVFDFQTLRKRKVNDKVLLPFILQVPQKKLHETGEQFKEYVLCAVQNHKGNSAHRGHYTAEVMDWSTGVWYEFDDEKVTLLEKGPKSSYDREALDGNSRGKNMKGSGDVYNVFYVTREYLAQSAIDQIDSHNKYLVKDSNTSTNCGNDIISKVTSEREEAHKHIASEKSKISEWHVIKKMRRLGIETLLGPSIFGDTAESDLHSSFSSSSCIEERKIWVDGHTLRRFISCEESMEEVILTKNGALLKHQHLLCPHGRLSPQTAQRGKLLNPKQYRAYVSLLRDERDWRCRSTVSTGLSSSFEVHDCEIWTDKNLVCEHCASDYKISLSKKSEKMSLIVDLYTELDSKNDKKDGGIDIYVVSSAFVYDFRKRALKFMRDVLADTSKSLQAGLAYLKLGTIQEIFQNKEDTDKIDQTVNSKITCHHGNLVYQHKRMVRFVPKSTWDKIVQFFPNAKSHTAFEGIGNNCCCGECLHEKNKEAEMKRQAKKQSDDQNPDVMLLEPDEMKQVTIHEFDQSFDVEAAMSLIRNELDTEKAVLSGESTVRRSSRRRGNTTPGRSIHRMTFSTRHNLATLRLRIHTEQCNDRKLMGREMMMMFTSKEKGESSLVLRNEWNAESLDDILKQYNPSSVDDAVINVIVYYTITIPDKRSRSEKRDDNSLEEALMDSLIEQSSGFELSPNSTASQSCKKGRRRNEELGFRGTLLQSFQGDVQGIADDTKEMEQTEIQVIDIPNDKGRVSENIEEVEKEEKDQELKELEDVTGKGGIENTHEQEQEEQAHELEEAKGAEIELMLKASQVSMYNLCPRALNATKPLYTSSSENIPPLPDLYGGLKDMDSHTLLRFIEKAKKECYDKGINLMGSFMEMFPKSARIKENICHIYRNFVDEPTNLKSEGKFMGISRREMDIVLYCLTIGMTYEECNKEIPYRENFKNIFNEIKGKDYHIADQYRVYMNHVKGYVRIMFVADI